MIDYLLELNNRILLAINGAHTGFLDTFMMIATNRWTWIPLYMAAFVYLIYRYGWLRAVSVLAVIGITITIVDQLCGLPIQTIRSRRKYSWWTATGEGAMASPPATRPTAPL